MAASAPAANPPSGGHHDADAFIVHSSSHPQLDLPQLQSLPPEQQEFFLFKFVSQLADHVLALSSKDCSLQQLDLKKTILAVLTLPAPQPSRVVRNNLGRCLAHILSKGDRKLLFETANDLVAIVSGQKSRSVDSDVRTCHAAVRCLGDVYSAAGDSAIGLHQLCCSTLLKLLKASTTNAGLRGAILIALGKMVKMIGKSMDESILKDIWKQARSHVSNEKGFLVVVAAFRCLQVLSTSTLLFANSTDFDTVKSVAFKAMESLSKQIRHAAAHCLADTLFLTYAESTVDTSASAKLKNARMKPLKRIPTQPVTSVDDDDVPSRSQSPAPASRRSLEVLLSVPEMLRILSTQYVKSSTSNRARAALGICYASLLTRLGERVVQASAVAIVENLSVEILQQPSITNNRYRLLFSRRIVGIVLGDIVCNRILGQAGQILVAKALLKDLLRNFPQALPERPEPGKHTIIVVLGALTSLIRSLGSAASSFATSCQDCLLQLLEHPSYSVKVFASFCIKAFVTACPQQLLPCLTIYMNSLSRELSYLGTPRSSPLRCVGFAYGLSAALSVSSSRPLHGSVDVNNRVLTMATNLLKSSGQSELRVSTIQIQVAWTLIGGLMTLGPNFVKIHLSQLLLLWKNALPKPLAKDNTSSRSYLESSFLTLVRECALSSVLAFLQSNNRLLTVDVSKRIATMLQNTTIFLKTLPAKKFNDDLSQRLTPALQLYDLDMMLQRRVLQCYVKLITLSPAGGSESLLQSNLLSLAVPSFCDPENYSPTPLGTSIANAAATFESVWEVGDNSGFGVTGLVIGLKVRSLPGQHQSPYALSVEHQSSANEKMDNLLLSPVCGSLEHDPSLLYIDTDEKTQESYPDPAATEVVNLAIQLFAFVFPLTQTKVQESILEQIRTFEVAGNLQRDPGRKAAITVNVATAILLTLHVAVKETESAAGDVSSPEVETLLRDMIRDSLIDPDVFVRHLGVSAVSRLCNVSGDAFTNQEIKYLVDTIVINREPSTRAGCAMALGAIQTRVGGISAGYHLKTILGILTSLCNDPHPTVHYWSLEALSMASDAAGLSFSAYVSGSLAILSQLYVSDTHHPELASTVTMNLEMDRSTTAAIARCVGSIINVLGPELQEPSKSRELVFSMVEQLQREEDTVVQRVGLACLGHLSLYAPGHVDFAHYVRVLQKQLVSDEAALQDVAVDGLHNIMKRDPDGVLNTADKGLEDQLWIFLDSAPGHDGMRNILRNWVRRTALSDTAGWVQRCHSVLKMTRALAREETGTASKGGRAALPDLRDEEVAGFAAAAGAAKDDKDGAPSLAAESEPLRWQVTMFALELLQDVFTLVAKDVVAHTQSRGQVALQSKIADVIKLAFSASTSMVLELRIGGLKIIGSSLKMFGKTPDPDFEEAMLLEQYQAQISSALAPAFAPDSSPELAAEAIRVCADFIATGIVTDVDRMGRILRTLVGALESFSTEGESASIGDLKGLSANAQVMVKVSVFAAWAELQVASSEQKYLGEVLAPHIATLTPLWLESLREFARLRFEPDISMTLGPPSLSGSLDTIYAALHRETLLRFYQDAWLRLVDAIASLIEQDSGFVFDALDGKGSETTTLPGRTRGQDHINYRDEPVAFFFVLFGLTFEALATRTGGHSDALSGHGQTLAVLQAVKKILHPSVSGLAIYRDAIFSETMDLLDRLALTDGLDVQSVIVDIARALCIHHPSARRQHEPVDESELSEDIEQLFELTRIIVLVLSGLVPNLTEGSSSSSSNNSQPVRHPMTDEAVQLVRTSLEALVDAADVFPPVIKTDLHACIIHILATLFATPSCQDVVVPQALPTLKRLVSSMTRPCPPSLPVSPSSTLAAGGVVAGSSREGLLSPSDMQLQGCLHRLLSIYLHAQKRETAASLPCVKNCLLATTVLFTGGHNQLPATEPLVARYLDEVVDCLTDRMTATIAVTCTRSLLTQLQKTAADATIVHYLLPRLLSFVAHTEPEDPEQARGLVARSLAQWAATTVRRERDQAAAAVALVLPCLLARAAGDGYAASYADTSVSLLELAAADPAVFRAVVAALNDGQRRLLDDIVRAGRLAGGADPDVDPVGSLGHPTIALKLFGD